MDRFEHVREQASERGPLSLPISRKKFVGLGLSSAALLSLGSFPLTARAQDALPIGHLKDYCIGDGREETEKIQQCFDDNRTVIVDAFNKAGNRAR